MPIDSVWASRVLSLLRIMAGLLFMQHGLSKYFAFPGPQPHGFMPISLIGLAGAIEMIGGALIALGLITRLAAFISSGEMAAAYFLAHAPHSHYPIDNGGDLAVLFCFVFLYFAAAGGGAWSLDRMLFRRA
jgi:putative oxidoreductase